MKKIVGTLISFIIVLGTVLALPFSVSAGKVIKETVSILNPRQNIRGDGYTWMNRYDELHLNNLNIDTTDDYGLKICDNAVVYIEGDNYIKASKAAVYCGGNVTFRGNGTLTLESDGAGCIVHSQEKNKTIRFYSGTYRIKAGEAGLRAEDANIALVGGNMEISVPNADGYAVDAYGVTVNSGMKLSADNSIRGTYKLNVSDAELKITSTKPALICDQYLSVAKVRLSVGNTANELTEADGYNGENCISSVSTVSHRVPSILFGEKYSIALDITLLISGILLLAAVIAIPKIIKYRKTKKILENRAGDGSTLKSAKQQ